MIVNAASLMGETTQVAATAFVPRLLFPLEVWQKLQAFVGACPVEINGFGLLVPQGSDYLVQDVIILEQVAGPAHVDNDPLVIARFMTDCIRAGIDTSMLRLQWHSHVTMPAYFSGTDTNNIERYAGQWMTSIVLNKYGEYEARLDVYKPFRMTAPLQITVLLPSSDVLNTHARDEVRAKVKIEGTFRNRPVKPNNALAETSLDGRSTTVVTGGS